MERILGGVTPWDEEYEAIMEQAAQEYREWESRKRAKRQDDKLRGIRIMNERNRDK